MVTIRTINGFIGWIGGPSAWAFAMIPNKNIVASAVNRVVDRARYFFLLFMASIHSLSFAPINDAALYAKGRVDLRLKNIPGALLDKGLGPLFVPHMNTEGR